MTKIAAIQLEPVIGDVAENLRRCRVLGDEAAATTVCSMSMGRR